MSVENLTEITDQLTRKDKIKKNPIPWLVQIVIGVLILIVFVLPKFNEHSRIKEEVASLNNTIPTLKTENKNLISINGSLKEMFSKDSGSTKIIEEQIFPKIIDTKKVVRVLEMLALQMDIAEVDNFQLDKVTFGKRTRMKGQSYTYNDADISLLTNMENLKAFIVFIQERKIPESVTNAKGSIITETDYTFLVDNLLPLANIESINITEDTKSENGDSLKVKMKIKFFSQFMG